MNEASWAELAKESMGGHSNTSAYSLVYIDTCKPELLLMDADWAGSIGETRGEQMDQGELEALAVTLPKDLAQFVIDDNNAFQEEIVQWDKEQQAQKLQEIMGTSQSQNTVPPLAAQDMDQNTVVPSVSDGNDLQVCVFGSIDTNRALYIFLIIFSLLGGGGEINVCQQPRQIVLGPDHVGHPSRRQDLKGERSATR